MTSIEDAIKTAITFETRVRDMYREAEQQVQGATGKRVLSALGDEEQDHLDYLKNRLEEWQRTGAVTAEHLETNVPSRQVIEAEVAKLKDNIEACDPVIRTDVELRMLKNALEVETETSEFYNRMVNELPEDGQELFARFVEIEEGHKALVQAELDYVNGPGYWFDFREFDLTGGG